MCEEGAPSPCSAKTASVTRTKTMLTRCDGPTSEARRNNASTIQFKRTKLRDLWSHSNDHSIALNLNWIQPRFTQFTPLHNSDLLHRSHHSNTISFFIILFLFYLSLSLSLFHFHLNDCFVQGQNFEHCNICNRFTWHHWNFCRIPGTKIQLDFFYHSLKILNDQRFYLKYDSDFYNFQSRDSYNSCFFFEIKDVFESMW